MLKYNQFLAEAERLEGKAVTAAFAKQVPDEGAYDRISAGPEDKGPLAVLYAIKKEREKLDEALLENNPISEEPSSIYESETSPFSRDA